MVCWIYMEQKDTEGCLLLFIHILRISSILSLSQKIGNMSGDVWNWNAPVQLQQLYLGHGLPKYEVKVETMLVFTGAHVKLGLATVLGETPWLFNMDQPKCLRGQNMSEHLRTQSFPRRVLVFLAAVHLPRLPLRLEISLAPHVALPRLGHQDAPRDIMQLFF